KPGKGGRGGNTLTRVPPSRSISSRCQTARPTTRACGRAASSAAPCATPSARHAPKTRYEAPQKPTRGIAVGANGRSFAGRFPDHDLDLALSHLLGWRVWRRRLTLPSPTTQRGTSQKVPERRADDGTKQRCSQQKSCSVNFGRVPSQHLTRNFCPIFFSRDPPSPLRHPQPPLGGLAGGQLERFGFVILEFLSRAT